MHKLTTDVFKLALGCFSTLALGAFALPAEAEPTTPQMSNEEILDIASGRTTIGTFSGRPISYTVFVSPDGQLIGLISDGASESLELGRWRVTNNTLCGQWNDLKNGEENCCSYHRVGANVHAYNTADGSLDRVQFFVDGDPLNLQQVAIDENASISEATSSTELIDTPDFREIVETQYFALWRDTEENPYSVELANNLYLNNDRLTAFDTDALPAEGEDSRIEGWSEYRQIWPEVFEGIKRFEATEISNFQVRRENDWALITFDMAGEVELEAGDAFDVFKHFTLVWTQTDDGWRIMHEHISDGQQLETAQ